MADHKRPLHSYEQSMLLSAMFFDSNNTRELLKFFPEEQAARMNLAKDQFLTLPRNERMTQIVLELRRLLLIDEQRIEWIHQSWIEDALAKEPIYLKDILQKSLQQLALEGEVTAEQHGLSNKLPLSLIFRMFIERLTTTPQKTAIYDPALMRLQSLKGEMLADSFLIIGIASVHAASLVLNAKRFFSYLERKGFKTGFVNSLLFSDINPFHNLALRQFFVRELIKFETNSVANCPTFAGLATTALYLCRYKYPWQRTIVLGLPMKLGLMIEAIISRLKTAGVVVDENHHTLISHLLITALDQGR
ncbi:MAG TPA: hypothetical protein VEL47_03870 [Myxococcota bacterium]|nr:hypothetical protein [Myxococcota bacterium]